jgi:5'-nucleotidase
MMLNKSMPPDVDFIKVDIPSDATPLTPWEVTRLSKQLYFEPVTPSRTSWDQPETVGYRRIERLDGAGLDTDVYAMRVKRLVSVTPLSLDMTSRVDLKDFEHHLRDA